MRVIFLNSLGGGIGAYDNSTLIISGGIIRNNTAATTGGGLDIANITFTLSGGTITGNKCNTSNCVGGLKVAGNNNASLSASANVTGNTPSNSNTPAYP